MSISLPVGVVIPANNEQKLLPGCLTSVIASAEDCRAQVDIVVVLDDCSDGSKAIVRQMAARTGQRVKLRCIDVGYRNVGAARARGVAALMDLRPSGHLWIASTDADTTVPTRWLAAQLAHARDGAGAVVGTVTVQDWDGRPERLRQQADALYAAGEHRHIHGANLSFSAAAYRRVGGFPPLACHEDVALVSALIAGGEQVVWATDLAVRTSGRRVGRTGAGFAAYLNLLEDELQQEPA